MLTENNNNEYIVLECFQKGKEPMIARTGTQKPAIFNSLERAKKWASENVQNWKIAQTKIKN